MSQPRKEVAREKRLLEYLRARCEDSYRIINIR